MEGGYYDNRNYRPYDETYRYLLLILIHATNTHTHPNYTYKYFPHQLYLPNHALNVSSKLKYIILIINVQKNI